MRTILDFHQGWARDDLLFTMSNNTRKPGRTRTGANLFKLLDERRAGSKAVADTACAPGMAMRRIASQRNVGPPICDRRSGGARRDRTDDLLLAKQALSQLSYGPFRVQRSAVRKPTERHICHCDQAVVDAP